MEITGRETGVRCNFVGVPAVLESRFLEAAAYGNFTKREFGMLAMMFAIRKMGMKVPKFRERAKLKAMYAHLVLVRDE